MDGDEFEVSFICAPVLLSSRQRPVQAMDLSNQPGSRTINQRSAKGVEFTQVAISRLPKEPRATSSRGSVDDVRHVDLHSYSSG